MAYQYITIHSILLSTFFIYVHIIKIPHSYITFPRAQLFEEAGLINKRLWYSNASPCIESYLEVLASFNLNHKCHKNICLILNIHLKHILLFKSLGGLARMFLKQVSYTHQDLVIWSRTHFLLSSQLKTVLIFFVTM